MQTENAQPVSHTANEASTHQRCPLTAPHVEPQKPTPNVSFCHRCGFPHADQFCPRCGHRQCIACGDG